MPVPRPYLPEKDLGNEGHSSTQASCLRQSKNKLMLSAAIVFVFIIAQFIGKKNQINIAENSACAFSHEDVCIYKCNMIKF